MGERVTLPGDIPGMDIAGAYAITEHPFDPDGRVVRCDDDSCIIGVDEHSSDEMYRSDVQIVLNDAVSAVRAAWWVHHHAKTTRADCDDHPGWDSVWAVYNAHGRAVPTLHLRQLADLILRLSGRLDDGAS